MRVNLESPLSRDEGKAGVWGRKYGMTVTHGFVCESFMNETKTVEGQGAYLCSLC